MGVLTYLFVAKSKLSLFLDQAIGSYRDCVCEYVRVHAHTHAWITHASGQIFHSIPIVNILALLPLHIYTLM